jgi:hypothetical protein
MTLAADFEDRLAARILGVDVDADAATIRTQFRRLARAVHPDTAVGEIRVDLGRLAAAKQRLLSRALFRVGDVGRLVEQERRRRAHDDARARMVRIRREQEARRRLERMRSVADLVDPIVPAAPAGECAGVPRRRSASAGRVGQLIDLAG